MKLKNSGVVPVGPPSTLPKPLPESVDSTLYTNKGEGLIDFVLAYKPLTSTDCQEEYRNVFEQKLLEEGVELEYQGLDESQDNETCFVKIHAPYDILTKLAEITRVKVAIQKSDLEEDEDAGKVVTSDPIQEFFCCGKTPFLIEESLRPPEVATFFTLEFTKEQMNYYLNKDPNTFFSQNQRNLLVWDLIQRVVVSTTEINGALLKGHKAGERIGINYLLKGGVYESIFLLHDGGTKTDDHSKLEKSENLWPLRPWLYEVWARPGRWHYYQPIDHIRQYFGEKIGLYFAWLGFYTTALIPLSLMGFIFFVWSLIIVYDDPIAAEVCDEEGFGNTIICRPCTIPTCQYTRLSDSCMYAVISVIMSDNSTTVALALATAFWAVFFLEFWKREEARLACKWDTFDLGYEYEPPRPEYQATAKEKRRHPITREWEPYVSARSRIQNLILSLSTVTFLISIVIALVIAVIIYKIVMVVYFYEWHVPLVDVFGSAMLTIGTASCINAICMVSLEALYSNVAWFLTEMEYPRTMSEFETSYTYKTYIFQFVNYYALLFYYSFVQPAVGSTPATATIFTDSCQPTGCSFSVTTQMTVVLLVKQALTDFKEIGLPWFQTWRKKRKHKKELSEGDVYAAFEKDYDLADLPPLGLLPEYLEMALQYGFVVMFGAVFPLAAVFALVNNVIEIRIDAYKFVACCRRPLPLRAANIGTWYSILEIVTYIAILSNALLIAFTTNLVDQFVYVTAYSTTGSTSGFINFTLSYFDTAEWLVRGMPELIDGGEGFGNVSSCRYRGYYNPPNHEDPYGLSTEWWIIMFSKFAFVVCFQNIMHWVQTILQYLIPDIPDDVELHLQRNRYISKAAAFKLEEEKEGNVKKPLQVVPQTQKYTKASPGF